MKLTFVQLSGFVADWRHLKLTDDDLRALELALLERPQAGRPIRGTGGLRKIRFAPPSWNRGKSGSVRICYAWFVMASVVCFVTAYAKSEMENITAAHRKHYRKLLQAIEAAL